MSKKVGFKKGRLLGHVHLTCNTALKVLFFDCPCLIPTIFLALYDLYRCMTCLNRIHTLSIFVSDESVLVLRGAFACPVPHWSACFLSLGVRRCYFSTASSFVDDMSRFLLAIWSEYVFLLWFQQGCWVSVGLVCEVCVVVYVPF